MSVIIKNMNMPKVCGYCRFYSCVGDCPLCLASGYAESYKFDSYNQRMNTCPLEEKKVIINDKE